MSKRIVIPVENKTGIDAPLAQHFGQAPYYAVVDLNENNTVTNISTEINQSEHVGGSGHPHDHLLLLKPDVFVVYGMGFGCLMSLKDAGLTVLKATGNTVKEIIDLFKQGQLPQLEGGCQHSHHDH